MQNLALRLDNVGKRYRIGSRKERPDTLVGAATQLIKAPLQSFRALRSLSAFDDDNASDVLWALRDVSFDIKHGEAVGLIGRNGAGKSTLLKILSRITEPSTGSISVYGRIASLLEVGTGFNDELTGRENTYLNGAILGMTRAEVDRKFDEIVAFSEIETFIDTPVKRYSSGMKVRLAFAVAAHLEPEILLVDEVLAVGDVSFQKKCLGKMDDVSSEGRTVVFVSHHMSMIQALCKRGVVLDGGRVTYDGGVTHAISEYLRSMTDSSEIMLDDRQDRDGDGSVRCTSIWFEDEQGAPVTNLISGQPATICLRYTSTGATGVIDFNLGIYDQFGMALAHNSTRFVPLDHADKLPHAGVARCRMARLPLPEGEYFINTSLMRDGYRADRVERAARFFVDAGDFYGSGKIPPASNGKMLVDYNWQVEEETAAIEI